MDELAKPLVTTLIPTYRRPALLGRALSCILAQRFPGVCVQVIDNCSGDTTPNVVESFRRRGLITKYHCHPTNIGGPRNFESALGFVDTPYFSFLSDDDILMPGFYQKGIEALENHPEAIFVVQKLLFVDCNLNVKNEVGERLQTGVHRPPEGFKSIFDHGPRTWTSMIFKSEILERERLDISLAACSDMEFIFRLAVKHSYIAVNHIGAAYVAHSSSYSGSYDHVLSDARGRRFLYRKILDDYPIPEHISTYAVSRLRRSYRQRLLRAACVALLNRDIKKAQRIIDALGEHGDNLRQTVVAAAFLLGKSILWPCRKVVMWKDRQQRLKRLTHVLGAWIQSVN
ncbi:glycosyltransferase family 2 protein [Candidatus Parcubacteria bacterium]|nr:MAG: glycosyltransferase family 2 protein [Candidatus Parcubacteria bacterium]